MKKSLSLLLAVATIASAQEKPLLTLDDALRIGRQNSRILLLAAARVDAAEGKAGAASSALLPSLKFEGSYRRLSDVPSFSIQLPVLPKPFVIFPTILDNFALRLSLQHPLFTGFKLSSNARAAEGLAQASVLDKLNDRDDLDLSITTAYWTLYQTIETKRVTDENVTRLLTYLRDSENMMKAGLATKNDVLKIQVQLNNARLQQIDAANDVQVAVMNLNNVMGRPVELDVQPASVPGQGSEADTILAGLAPEPAAELTEQALRLRHDVQAMETRVEAAQASVKGAQGNLWPQLFLSANYYYSQPNARYQPPQSVWKDSWDVGVTLQFDLWNWGLTSYETDQAKATLAQNQTVLEQLKENVTLEIRRQTMSLQRSREKVQVAQLGVDQAEENLRTASDKYKNGVATSTDLLDANVSLLQARTSRTGALVEHELAVARLKRALGTKDEIR